MPRRGKARHRLVGTHAFVDEAPNESKCTWATGSHLRKEHAVCVVDGDFFAQIVYRLFGEFHSVLMVSPRTHVVGELLHRALDS